MTSEPNLSLSEYHRLPPASPTAEFYKRQLEVVCNNATLALFIMDEQQQCVYMNPAAEALTGYCLAETQGRPLHDIIHHTRPDGRPYPLCECPIDQAFPTNNREQGEEVFVHRDGHFYSVAYTASPIREGDSPLGELQSNRPIGTIIEVRDITKEKQEAQAKQEAAQREQALRQEAESARQSVEMILSSINDGFYVLNRDWRFTYVNDRYCEMVGMSRDNLLGQSVWELFPSAVDTDSYVQFHQAMQEQTPRQFDYLYLPWNCWHTHRVYPSSQGLTVFLVDITEQKQAEESLQESKDRLELALAGAKQGIWDLDIKRQILTCDDRCKEIFGLPPDAPATYGWFVESLHPDDRLRVTEAAWIALRERTEFCQEFRTVKPDRTISWVLARGRVFYSEANEPYRMSGTVLDITDRKQTELERENLLVRERRYTHQLQELTAAALAVNAALSVEQVLQVITDRAASIIGAHQSVTSLTIDQNWAQAITAVSLSDKYAQWRDYDEPTDGTGIYAYVCHTNRPMRLTQAELETHPQWTAFNKAAAKHLPLHGWLAAPLIGRDGRNIGLIQLSDKCEGEFTETDESILVQLAQMAAVALENTRLYEAEQQARSLAEAAEARLENLLASIREDFVVLDPQWNFAYLNPQGAATLQISRETALGKNFWDLFPDLVGTEFYDRLHQVMQEQIPIQFEYYYDLWDRWFENRVYPTADGIVNLCVDITERKRIEADLLQKNAIVDTVSKSSSTLIYAKDRMGRMLMANDAALNALGLSQSEVIGHTASEFNQPPEIVDRLIENDRLVLESGQTQSFEESIESPTGQRVFLSVKSPYYNEMGEVAGLVGVSTDITDRVQLERDRERLLQREQAAREAAETANRIKDEFLAVLSHELRSPLNPILGWAKLLRSGNLNPAKIDQALATIERNAKLQSELIEDLLDVSRILQGKLSLNISSVNLAVTAQSAIETVRLAAEVKSIQVTAHFDPEVGQVWGDATRLQQVVWNLLSNAVKFTPAGGRVEVRLERMNEQAQITVCDSGKGIPTHFLPYVFDYFRQEDGATTRKFGGLGLGLAIVRHLVELHGGTVAADSPGEGLGATFTVKLPLMAVKPLPDLSGAVAETALDLKGISALVIDDEADSREFVSFVLEQAGAHVTVASTASEGFLLLTQSPPDILLSDIGMPDMDGYMLMSQVRRHEASQSDSLTERGEPIKAIALTAYAGDFNQQQAIAAGFQHHLSKPIEPEALVRAIVNLLKPSDSHQSAKQQPL